MDHTSENIGLDHRQLRIYSIVNIFQLVFLFNIFLKLPIIKGHLKCPFFVKYIAGNLISRLYVLRVLVHFMI